jgi:hypothetical protein
MQPKRGAPQKEALYKRIRSSHATYLEIPLPENRASYQGRSVSPLTPQECKAPYLNTPDYDFEREEKLLEILKKNQISAAEKSYVVDSKSPTSLPPPLDFKREESSYQFLKQNHIFDPRQRDVYFPTEYPSSIRRSFRLQDIPWKRDVAYYDNSYEQVASKRRKIAEVIPEKAMYQRLQVLMVGENNDNAIDLPDSEDEAPPKKPVSKKGGRGKTVPTQAHQEEPQPEGGSRGDEERHPQEYYAQKGTSRKKVAKQGHQGEPQLESASPRESKKRKAAEDDSADDAGQDDSQSLQPASKSVTPRKSYQDKAKRSRSSSRSVSFKKPVEDPTGGFDQTDAFEGQDGDGDGEANEGEGEHKDKDEDEDTDKEVLAEPLGDSDIEVDVEAEQAAEKAAKEEEAIPVTLQDKEEPPKKGGQEAPGNGPPPPSNPESNPPPTSSKPGNPDDDSSSSSSDDSASDVDPSKPPKELLKKPVRFLPTERIKEVFYPYLALGFAPTLYRPPKTAAEEKREREVAVVAELTKELNEKKEQLAAERQRVKDVEGEIEHVNMKEQHRLWGAKQNYVTELEADVKGAEEKIPDAHEKLEAAIKAEEREMEEGKREKNYEGPANGELSGVYALYTSWMAACKYLELPSFRYSGDDEEEDKKKEKKTKEEKEKEEERKKKKKEKRTKAKQKHRETIEAVRVKDFLELLYSERYRERFENFWKHRINDDFNSGKPVEARGKPNFAERKGMSDEIEAKSRDRKRWLYITGLQLLLLMVNQKYGTTFNLGVVYEGFRGQKKKDGSWDRGFVYRTCATILNSRGKEGDGRPWIWVYNDNGKKKGEEHRLEEKERVDRYLGFAKLEGHIEDIEKQKGYGMVGRWKVARELRDEVKYGFWQVIADCAAGSGIEIDGEKWELLGVEKGHFVRDVFLESNWEIPRGYWWM